VLAIHEDMDPTSVQTGLSSFRAGSHRVLITTDSLSFGAHHSPLSLARLRPTDTTHAPHTHHTHAPHTHTHTQGSTCTS
jgi:hypothetical protein